MLKNELSGADDNLQSEGMFLLKLFITGAAPSSARAVVNLKLICEKYLKNKYELEIIDIYQQPQKAQHEQIIALPTLVKSSPLPLKRLIGDMSDLQKVLDGLGIKNNNGI